MTRILITVIIFILLLPASVLAISPEYYIDSQGNLRLENDYIAIFVNRGDENLGRFALDVTGGNPIHDGDNNKPLLYGHPRPWTSYSTIRIDGKDYVFGGPTNKRAGSEGLYGEVVNPPEVVDGEKIITVVKMDNVEVTQTLSFIESTTTGLPDTAKIKYTITNKDSETRNIGLRVMLDTMLGANDGAPFRVLDQAITEDKTLIRGEIPDFWQAFDSLTNPMVMAQGGLRGPDLTAPDKIYFSNWGSLADGVWDFNFQSGRDFIREGEFELDSAIALYWTPTTLETGESITYTTSYGLGGITIVPGLLSLGVTSPANFVFDELRKSFPIVAYIENTSSIIAKDVIAQLDLPEELMVEDHGPDRKELYDVGPGEHVQVAWRIKPKPGEDIPEESTFRVLVEAENTDSNEATRNIKFFPPARLEVLLDGPSVQDISGRLFQYQPFTVTGTVKNTGGSTSYNTKAYLALPPGLSLAYSDKGTIDLGPVKAGEEIEISWRILSQGITGDMPYGLEVHSINTPQSSQVRTIEVPEAPSKIYLDAEQKSYAVGEIIAVDIIMANIRDLQEISLDMSYDKEVLDPLYVSRGGIFTKKDELLPFKHPKINTPEGTITGLQGNLLDKEVSSGVVATIYFLARRSGDAVYNITSLKLIDRNGKKIDILPDELMIRIKN